MLRIWIVLLLILVSTAVKSQSCFETTGLIETNNGKVVAALTTSWDGMVPLAGISTNEKLFGEFLACIDHKFIINTENRSSGSITQSVSEIFESSEQYVLTRLYHAETFDLWEISFPDLKPESWRWLSNYKKLQHVFAPKNVVPNIAFVKKLSSDGEKSSTKRNSTSRRPLSHYFSELWKSSTGEGVKVAVIDDGFNLDHPSLGLQKPQITSHKSSNENHHGTLVATSLFALHQAQYQFGISPDAQFVPLPLNQTYTSDLIKLFATAKSKHVDVINLSWVLPLITQPLTHVIEDLSIHGRQNKGIIIVAAAGNALPEFKGVLSLAGIESIIAVNGIRARNSKPMMARGDYIDIGAPSSFLTNHPANVNSTIKFSGSSAATAFVSGLAALALARCPSLTNDEFQTHLYKTAVKVDPAYQQHVGAGEVDIQRFWQRLEDHCKA
ncbi:serine protease [Vibrio maritimus]|uniref:Serine protease n=1 Tax=Vibrio maritimus TaxID=990268 RepID=A0A090TB44_9VIBR|nr:serine protease [Vibrio maritimus]